MTEHNFSHVDTDEMIDLYGELYKFSDRKIGERITYRVGNEIHNGEILWISGPGDVVEQHVPMSYIVNRDMPGNVTSFPDIVYRTDVIE